jgi:hypothetical protein
LAANFAVRGVGLPFARGRGRILGGRTREHVDVEDVGMAKRHRHPVHPVAEQQRRLVVQRIWFALLVAFTLFMVVLAVTSR